MQRPVLRNIVESVRLIVPNLNRGLAQVAKRRPSESPRGWAVQWGTAMFRAVRLLLDAGGMDLTGSLAYFTILSLFPLVTVMIMALSIFTDPVVMQEKLADTLVYFFPASRELLQNAIIRLFSGSLALGLIALGGIVVSANGLFMAANRSVNRVFGIETRKPAGTMTTEVVIGTVLLVMFMFSVGFTILFRFATSVGGTSAFLVFSSRAVSEALSAGLTAMMFGVMYYRLPNTRVMWKDAAFGGLIAVVLFEAGKHLFFWFTNMASERSAVYGPVASVVILLMWAYIVGLIFLYGAALTRCMGELRPKGLPGDDRRQPTVAAGEDISR